MGEGAPAPASPFGPIRLVVNPRAGRGAIAKALPSIEESLRDEGLEFDVVQTEGPGHAIELARTAVAEGHPFVVAVGGDGTVHEVVNGLIDDGKAIDGSVVLGIVPSGTGCDFAKTFGIRADPVAAARGLSGNKLWGTLDIPRVTYRSPSGSTETRYFVNIAETGIGAQVVRSASSMRRFGARAYRLAAIRGILGYKPQESSVVMQGRKARGRRDAEVERLTHGGMMTMIVVANCQFFGGGLRVAPRAIPSDGMLDVLVGEGTKMQALAALRKMPLGQHVPSDTITEYLAVTVEIEGTEPVWLEADGEVLGTTPVTIELLPDVLQMKA